MSDYHNASHLACPTCAGICARVFRSKMGRTKSICGSFNPNIQLLIRPRLRESPLRSDMITTQHFTTQRLHLRQILASDISFVGKLITHEEVRRFLGGAVPIAQYEATMSGYLSAGEGKMAWLVETMEARHPIGLIFISHHADGEDCELSYQFHPDAWGFGYATEAAMRIVEFALKDLRLKRLIAETQSANAASRRLLERLGMKELRRLHRFGAQQVVYVI